LTAPDLVEHEEAEEEEEEEEEEDRVRASMRAFCWAGSGITAENETERSAFLPNLDVSCLGCEILLDRLVGTLIFKVSCASSLIDSAQLSSVCSCFFAVLFTKDKTISCALALDAPAACWCTGTHVPLLMPDE